MFFFVGTTIASTVFKGVSWPELGNENIFKIIYPYSLSLGACYTPTLVIMVEMTLYITMMSTTRVNLGLGKRLYHTVVYLDKNSKK